MPRLTRKVTRTEQYYGRQRTVTKNEVTGFGMAVFGALGFGLAYIGLADSRLDMLGDVSRSEDVSVEAQNDEALRTAAPKYDQVYADASPAGKYALQFLTTTDVVTTVRRIEPNNGSGLLGLVSGDPDDKIKVNTRFGDNCLANTAYDINGGNIEGLITGLFVSGSIEGEIPTAAANAYVASDSPDTLTIQSGHANSRDLSFRGLSNGSYLVPADQQTQDVLQTYGCELERAPIQEPAEWGARSSSWIS